MQASQSSSRSEILLSSLHMVFKRFCSPPYPPKAQFSSEPVVPYALADIATRSEVTSCGRISSL